MVNYISIYFAYETFNFLRIELRAQMMSASLLSDMESFKAANPNGKIEDFIRWYSPRDWIEDSAEGMVSYKLLNRLKIIIFRWQ